jgi:hypothetical protein
MQHKQLKYEKYNINTNAKGPAPLINNNKL